MFQHDVIMAMRSDVDHQARGSFTDVATFPASALYDDWQGNHFRADMDLSVLAIASSGRCPMTLNTASARRYLDMAKSWATLVIAELHQRR